MRQSDRRCDGAWVELAMIASEDEGRGIQDKYHHLECSRRRGGRIRGSRG